MHVKSDEKYVCVLSGFRVRAVECVSSTKQHLCFFTIAAAAAVATKLARRAMIAFARVEQIHQKHRARRLSTALLIPSDTRRILNSSPYN